MNKIATLLLALIALNTISAQTVTRALKDFSTLSISNAIEVRLVQGEKNEVVISVPESKEQDLEHIKTEVIGGKLSIYRKGKVKSKENIVIILTFKHLNKIIQNGASEISTLAVIREKELVIKGSGAIEADLNLELTGLTIDFSGASDIKLSGAVKDFTIKSSGSSDINAAGFIADNVILDISGASDIKVNATESIRGKVTGASSIKVAGSPLVREINTGGASSSSYVNKSNVAVKIGGQYLKVSDGEDDVEVKLGNKEVIVIDDGDTVRVKWGHTELVLLGDSVEIVRTPKKRRSHWSGVDLAINGFLNSSNSIHLNPNPETIAVSSKDFTGFMELNYAKSWTFAINFVEWYIPIHKHRFGLVTGLGTEWNNYELKHNIKLNPQGGKFVHDKVDEYNKDYTWGEVDTLLDYSKNRFKTWFVNAPLLLVLNTGDNKNKSFHLSAGAIFGLNLQTKMKYKYRLDGDNKKEKDKQSFNTNPFRVSATVRGGVGRFNVFATYSLTPLFESGRGPELYPFTIGITLLGF